MIFPAVQPGPLTTYPGIWLIGAKGMLGRQLALEFAGGEFDFFAGDAKEPYRENAQPRPLSRYGWSKWQGEIKMAAVLGTFFLFRISWLYGVYGPNFVHTMQKIFREKETARVVNDQFGAPTYAAALIGSDSDRFGEYHYCDRGAISWFDFAAATMEMALESGMISKKIPLHAVSTSAFPSAETRPPYSVLDCGKAVRELDFQVHDWQLNLKRFFREKAALEETL